MHSKCIILGRNCNRLWAIERVPGATLIGNNTKVLPLSLTRTACQDYCFRETDFVCRSVKYKILDTSYGPNGEIAGICTLSDSDRHLLPSSYRVSGYEEEYFENQCVAGGTQKNHISVTCSPTYMTAEYDPEVNFFGKVYMQGYSENPECFAIGQGRYKVVTLKLPLLTSSCGIFRAEGTLNRTLLSGTMVIQYNPIIQTQGDRIIRVGCIFGNESKVLLGTGVKITSSLPNKGSTLLNSSSNRTTSPVVENESVRSKYTRGDSYDIWASHLIAMTEKNEESIFLLDDRGCPTNLNIFPPMEKVYINGSRYLMAHFRPSNLLRRLS
ncbi:hypothetical protein NQ318_017732 [Aromia moschata]|uniref:Uncharacterized protein n=1 Tax=Aromia moschata TaxID=1265417 RepID=A0AAV8XPZ5_9CUCU|nr:hypothetical protein NQ318_017732 [Aromia moschata]